MATRISRIVGGAAECFVMRTAFERRRAGAWRTEHELTFPSYVFLGVGDPDSLERALEIVTTPLHLPHLGSNLAELSPAEASLLTSLMDSEHVIRVSRGVIEGGSLRVWEGPLAGHEGLVCRIERHRRVAYVGAGRDGVGLRVGLEVVSKS